MVGERLRLYLVWKEKSVGDQKRLPLILAPFFRPATAFVKNGTTTIWWFNSITTPLKFSSSCCRFWGDFLSDWKYHSQLIQIFDQDAQLQTAFQHELCPKFEYNTHFLSHRRLKWKYHQKNCIFLKTWIMKLLVVQNNYFVPYCLHQIMSYCWMWRTTQEHPYLLNELIFCRKT